MLKLISLAIIPALWVALWADLAEAIVRSECYTPQGLLIPKSAQFLPDTEAERRIIRVNGRVVSRPCIAFQSEVITPVLAIKPNPRAIQLGLVPAGMMPVTTEFVAFPTEFDGLFDVAEVSGGFLSVDCQAETGAGASLGWYFEPKIAGASMSVEGTPPQSLPQTMQPGSLHLIHTSNSPPIDSFPPTIDVLPRAAFMAPDGSSIVLEAAEAHLNTEAGTCVGKARVTYQDGE